ncbi:D-arabinono-1,4-lactone oxidase [Agromyces sp. H3Y2-19a]|uniref:D-arabinono-1,4-lactone oxidase n=1 Tax=Agromyces chromiiresistens TaxID=3030835 RepID=UPI0023BA24DD|nr:D-arabinono-1,4-lactone oxidase [Agromyces chromiiresistens]MDF0513681.1 D-arabinono-1,4-lactone oxidase [Agromyces chromiiresistens]
MRTSEGRRNWAGNLGYRASRVVRPRSVAELQNLLADPGWVGGDRFRALGSRHSFNDLADTAGTHIETDGLPVEVDAGSAPGAVRISGGLRYGALAEALHARGLALANLASLPHISVAGAIATGTHGSGDRLGSLASAVRAIAIVGGDGEVRSLRRGDADFEGVVVNLGALGVVVALELDVEPAYAVAQHVFDGPRWDAVLDGFDRVTSLATSVSVFTTWQRTDRADLLWLKQRADASGPGADGEASAFIAGTLGATAAASPRHPVPGGDARATTEQLGAPGPWHERLPHFRLAFTPSAGEELQSEYLVPRRDAVAAIAAVRSLADRVAPLLHVCEIRTVAADRLWLSSSYGVDAVGIHFTWRREQAAVEALLPRIEAALPATARPHWGKLFALPGEEVASRYPRWRDFAVLRERFDPERRFVNSYLERLGL